MPRGPGGPGGPRSPCNNQTKQKVAQHLTLESRGHQQVQLTLFHTVNLKYTCSVLGVTVMFAGLIEKSKKKRQNTITLPILTSSHSFYPRQGNIILALAL